MDDKPHEEAIHGESQRLWQQIETIKKFPNTYAMQSQKVYGLYEFKLESITFEIYATVMAKSIFVKKGCIFLMISTLCCPIFFNYRASWTPKH